MFEIVFLGTSAAAPSVRRSLSSHVVLHEEYRFMIDCGEGAQRQLLKSGLGFKRLDKILLTHGHLDHILGLGGLLSTFMRWETIDRVEIYGGRSALDRVEDLVYRVVLRGARPALELSFIEVKPGLLMEDDSFGLSAFPVSHRGGDCFGYLFREKSRRPFLVDRAEALGVPPGPERRRLVGGEAVRLADGRTIEPDQVLGPEIRGAVLAHVGDAGRTSDLLEHVRGADALVIESTYLEGEADLARAYDHLTAAQAARLAREAQVGQLILTHISRRYSQKQVLAEAQALFPNTVVARDFDRFRVLKDQSMRLAESIVEEEEDWNVAA
ncbi:MAG: ribonuclease Z [Anaerolineae bacterium]